MYRSLLVPLDQSTLAEQALPLSLAIARRARARLDLVKVHVLYSLEDATAGRSPFRPDWDDESKQQEQLYLDATARWLTAASPVTVTTSVLPGATVLPEMVADSILEQARARGSDLIVTTTHGRGPVSRFGLGSVADELVRRAAIPILLTRPGDRRTGILPEPLVENILIPLDGTELAEQILPSAVELARLMDARCTLVRVVESRAADGKGGPTGSFETVQAEAYLAEVAAKLRVQGLQPPHTRVMVARHAAEAILVAAATEPNNLVALATHGRSGLGRLLLGSVADKLVRSATSPILVMRPTETRLHG